ncbi:MAG: enoyl-CoA hydratase/isomerase family protein [Parachlamydiaceae bacterium]|nr:enoyl-CoA hydratase/isomerase family protein [Parachlamydiaceae bacterium]
MYKYLIFEKQAVNIGILRINRPDVLNALNYLLLEELLDFLEKTAVNEKCKAIILTGAGEKSFIAGADIKEMNEFSALQMLGFCELGQKVTFALEKASYLSIAAINGYALGGGLEMALACDFIYASKNAKMGSPEVHLGIIPGFGGSHRLSRAIGTRKAKELIMSGRTFNANEAFEMGIVNKVCPEESLLKECITVANEIIENSMTAVLQVKNAINCCSQMGIVEALELERNMCAVCFATEDRVKGMGNFLEKHGRR